MDRKKTPFYPIFNHAKLLILHYIYTDLDRMDRFLYIITREKKIIMIIRKKIIYIYNIYRDFYPFYPSETKNRYNSMV